MYWTLELASKLEDAPWPATKEELIDYAVRSGAPLEVLENLQEIEDEGDIYERSKTSGPTTPPRTTSSSTRRSIDDGALPAPTNEQRDAAPSGVRPFSYGIAGV